MKRILWALVTTSLLLTGCGSKGDGSVVDAQDPYFLYEKNRYTDRIINQIPFEDELIVGLVGLPKNLHPHYAEDRSSKILVNALFDKLFYLTEDEAGEKAFIPQLVNLTVSDDRLVYTLTVEEGMTWHDGQPVTADDLVYTFESVQNKDTLYGSALEVSGQKVAITKVDDKTVTLTLPVHSNTFVYALSEILVIPAHLKATFDQPLLTGEEVIIGNSAYAFVERLIDADEDFTYEDETFLVAADNPRGQAAEIKKMRFKVVKHMTTTRKHLTDYDVSMGEILAREAEGLRTRIFNTYRVQENDTTAVVFKLKNPLMQQEDLRKAILQTITPASYSGHIGNTYYTHAANSIFGEDTAYRTRKDIYYDAGSGEARLTFLRYMQEDPDFKIRIGFIVDVGEPQEKFAIAWQEMMTGIGVPVEMVPMYQRDYYAKAYDPETTDFDFCLVDIPGSINPNAYRIYFDSASDHNYSGLADPELDAMWDLADAALTRNEAMLRYGQIQDRILSQRAVYPLINYVRVFAADDRIQGIEEAVPGSASLVEHWEKLSIQDFEMDQALVEKYEIELDKLKIRGQEDKPLIETEPVPIKVPAGEENYE